MPFKSERIKIAGGKYDRRVKLTQKDKDKILSLRDKISIHDLAKMFGVHRRTIQFILYPERQARNLELREERGGSKIYYDREKQNASIREHRRYKQELYLEGKIK